MFLVTDFLLFISHTTGLHDFYDLLAFTAAMTCITLDLIISASNSSTQPIICDISFAVGLLSSLENSKCCWTKWMVRPLSVISLSSSEVLLNYVPNASSSDYHDDSKESICLYDIISLVSCDTFFKHLIESHSILTTVKTKFCCFYLI